MSGLAVDVGQTGIRVEWKGRMESTDVGVRALTDSASASSVVAEVSKLARRLAAKPLAVGVGLSGFVEGSDTPHQLASELAVALGAERVTVAADAVTAFLGTLGEQPGTVAICGTGIAVLGFDGVSGWRRIDARGYLLGDFGSGFWIGQRGLQAAIDGVEKRGPATSLTAAAERLGSPSEIYLASMAMGGAPKYLAEFAPDVLTAAEQGDVIAAEIVSDAGEQIAMSVEAAIVGDGVVGLTGGLTRSSTFLAAVQRALIGRSGPTELVVRPDAGIEGARVLTEQSHETYAAFPGLVTVEDAR